VKGTTQGRADHRDPEASEAGVSTAELCRQHNITGRWKAKYAGTDSSDTAWHLIDEPGASSIVFECQPVCRESFEDSLFRRDDNDTWEGTPSCALTRVSRRAAVPTSKKIADRIATLVLTADLIRNTLAWPRPL